MKKLYEVNKTYYVFEVKINPNLYDKNKYDYLKNEEIQYKSLESMKRLISKKLDNEHKISLKDWLISQIDNEG